MVHGYFKISKSAVRTTILLSQPAFSGVFTIFEFLCKYYKHGLIYTLVDREVSLCFNKENFY